MANTLLRYEVEPYVRVQLATQFGKVFRSQRLPLPGGVTREFDAVSDDGSIVVSIKTSSGLTSGRNLPGGKIKAAIADLYSLSLISAPVRWLVLTNPKFHEIFPRVMDGAVSPGATRALEIFDGGQLDLRGHRNEAPTRPPGGGAPTHGAPIGTPRGLSTQDY